MVNTLAGKKGAGLKDLSRKPKKSPQIMKMYWQSKIKNIAEKAAADNKRINSVLIKHEYHTRQILEMILQTTEQTNSSRSELSRKVKKYAVYLKNTGQY